MGADRSHPEPPSYATRMLDAVGRLAGDVAHDLNNLLAVILGCNELALRKLSADDPVHELVEQVHKAAIRAARLSSQLLACGRELMLAPAPAGTETILLVVDEDAVRTLAAVVLQGHGYRVLEAESDEAVQLAQGRAEPLHLLVADLAPWNLQLAQRLASIHPGLKTLYLCGAAAQGGAEPLVAPAGTAVLHRPFSPANLACQVRAVLDGHVHSTGATDAAL